MSPRRCDLLWLGFAGAWGYFWRTIVCGSALRLWSWAPSPSGLPVAGVMGRRSCRRRGRGGWVGQGCARSAPRRHLPPRRMRFHPTRAPRRRRPLHRTGPSPAQTRRPGKRWRRKTGSMPTAILSRRPVRKNHFCSIPSSNNDRASCRGWGGRYRRRQGWHFSDHALNNAHASLCLPQRRAARRRR